MEFFLGVLQNLLGGLAAQAGANLIGVLKKILISQVQDMKGPEIQKLLTQLGTTTPETIRQLVDKELGKDKRLTKGQREDVAACLISVSRGASLLNTQGNPRSSYVKCQDLIEQLLAQMQPKRKAGEKVCKNHDWVLCRFLGLGTFGEVWLAENSKAPALTPRAYKFFTGEGARHWLEQEQNSLNQIKNKLKIAPQIVQLLDVTVPDEDDPFLVLEYVEGGSLEEWLLDPDRRSRPLRKRDVLRGIVRAMAAAHQQGIYHGDLKPANILLTPSPDVQPKITDFGLSSIDSPSQEEATAATRSELVQVGTPLYWPPEAQRPFAERKPALFDIFAIGVIWYQLLVERIERPPYDFTEELRRVGQDTHTIQLISRCLAHPERRWADACELDDHLEDADLPVWDLVPAGLFDVQYLVREYVSLSAR